MFGFLVEKDRSADVQGIGSTRIAYRFAIGACMLWLADGSCDWDSLIVNRQSSIVNRQSSIVNRQSSIVNRQSSIVNRQSSIVNRRLSVVGWVAELWQSLAADDRLCDNLCGWWCRKYMRGVVRGI
ncbi:hypothetical protein O5966_18315 [Xanthomonas oryzae pv. oryzae]|uniref:hypothetical protein n=1 Tax=Xanthomonas oryzae TaxID=347 RepID=UPI0022B2360E|nr:hypothetical protein [Xanthomonas oryzae]WAY23775.1 hypothetical protein O5966_18315 [Xanthomonas oryzae pv. oryzae]